MAERGGKRNGRRRGKVLAWGCRFRSTLIACVALLGFVLQPIASVQHVTSATQSDVAGALGELAAVFGPNVVICEHDNGSAPAAPTRNSHSCCDDCALCQSAGHAAAVAPPEVDLPTKLFRVAAHLDVPDDIGLTRPAFVLAQPRAPPVFA